MQKRPINILSIVLFFNSLLFIVLYSVLSYNSRLASDDFYYLWLKNTYGAWGGMVFQYENWSGRWTAHSIACGLLYFWENSFFLPLLNLGTLAALYLAFRSLLKKIFAGLNFEANGIELAGLSIMLIISFFFATFSIGESWFWYIIVITYMWSLICFLFLLNFILTNNNKLNWILTAAAAVFIGGASESLAIVFMIMLATYLYYIRKHISEERKSTSIKVGILLSLILISFLFSVLAPGTEIRRSLLPQTTLLFKGWSYIKSIGKYFVIYLPAHAGFIFIFSFPWLLFGMTHLKEIFNIEEKRRILKLASLMFLSVLFITLIPTTYVMSDAGPDRAMILISLITSIYFAIIFTIAGTYIQQVKNFNVMSAIICTISILVLLIVVYVQSEITGRFSGAYDKRMKTIQIAKEKHVTGVISVPALPEPGMLYWEELSNDSGYFTNQHLKKGLGLSFSVIAQPE